MCICVFKLFFEITEPTEDKDTWGNHRIGEKNSNDSSQFFYYYFVSPRGRGLLAGILPQIWSGSAGLLAGL